MFHINRLSVIGIIALSILCLPQANASNQFYFDLELEQQRILLRDLTRLEVNKIGFRYRESLYPHLSMDFKLGQMGVDHEKDNSTLGFHPAGYYTGLGIQASTSNTNRLQAGLDLSYDYYAANDDHNNNRIEITWAQGEARLWLALQISTHFKLFACATALSIDGKQHLKGSNPTRTDFKNEDKAGICGGLILQTADHGYVGVEGYGGNKQGGRIYFGKRF